MVISVLLLVIVAGCIWIRRLKAALAAERSKAETEHRQLSTEAAERLQRLAPFEGACDVIRLDAGQITDIARSIRKASGYVAYCAKNLLAEKHKEQVIEKVISGVATTEQELEHLLEIARDLDKLTAPPTGPSDRA